MAEIARSSNIFAWISVAISLLFIYGIFWGKAFVVERDRRFLRIKMFDRYYNNPILTEGILRFILRIRAAFVAWAFYYLAVQIATYL
jgi:hypothetical protein